MSLGTTFIRHHFHLWRFHHQGISPWQRSTKNTTSSGIRISTWEFSWGINIQTIVDRDNFNLSTLPQYIGWGNTYRYQISILKDTQYHIRNCQLKQRDTTTFLLECPKCEILALPNADQHGNNRNSHLLLVEMQNDTIIWDNSLLLCPKSWKLCSHRKLHANIYRSFIHNRQNLEATKMSFSRRKE